MARMAPVPARASSSALSHCARSWARTSPASQIGPARSTRPWSVASGARRRHERDRMDGAVEHRADQLGHAGIGDQVGQALGRSRLDADDAGEEPAGIGDQGAAGLQDEAGGIGQVRADRFRQGCGVGGGQAATQVDAGRGRQRGGDIGQAGGQLREGVQGFHRGADVRADARRLAAGLAQGGQGLRQVRDRDAELGGCRAGRQVRMRRSVQARGSGAGRCARRGGRRPGRGGWPAPPATPR